MIFNQMIKNGKVKKGEETGGQVIFSHLNKWENEGVSIGLYGEDSE